MVDIGHRGRLRRFDSDGPGGPLQHLRPYYKAAGADAHAGPNANCHPDAADTNAFPHVNTHAFPFAHPYGNAGTHTGTYPRAYAFALAYTHPHTKTHSNAGARLHPLYQRYSRRSGPIYLAGSLR